MPKFLLLLLCFFSSYSVYAQQAVVYGRLLNAADKTALPGATVFITKEADSSPLVGGTTDVAGKFQIGPVAPGKYILRVQF